MVPYFNSNGFLLAGVVLHLLVERLLSRHFRASQRGPYSLPLGPLGEPLLGHFRLVPAVSPEQRYIEWGKMYDSDIDAVTNEKRLPTFEDRERLPYLGCVIEEATRCVPPLPLGVPHASLEDGVNEGMLIPRGSVLYADAQAMAHGERVYSNPDVFSPDRYVPKEDGGLGEPAPEGPFGFGRRVCVGKHLALADVYIFMSNLIAIFNLKPIIDAEGKEMPPRFELTVCYLANPHILNVGFCHEARVRYFYKHDD